MIFFHCRKIPILFILMCIEFTAKNKINRGYLLCVGEYQVYFIECGGKVSIFHECVANLKVCRILTLGTGLYGICRTLTI